MIDIHSHIAFGLDDGAKTLEESIQLAEFAIREGISTIVATPHHRHPKFTNSGRKVQMKLKQINEELIKRNIPLKVLGGQEIRIFGDLAKALADEEELLTINNSRYVLVEFPSQSVPPYTEQVFFEMQLKGYIPIIAHPERNAELMEYPDLLYKLVKKGALSQVTATSIAGTFGKKIQKKSFQFLEYGLSQIVASDVHNLTNRSFQWKEAFSTINKKFGREFSYSLNSNAKAIVLNHGVVSSSPERIPKKKLFGLL